METRMVNASPAAAKASGSSRIELRIAELSERIAEDGERLDGQRALTAALAGGAVIFILLAVLALLDLITDRANVWLVLGVTRGMLIAALVCLGAAGLGLAAGAFLRVQRRDRAR